MKLSVFSTTKTLLHGLGAPAQGSIRRSFPAEVAESYLPVWEEYLTTAVVKDIMKRYDTASARYFVCAGFVSYIQSIDRKSVSKAVDLNASVQNYNVGPNYRTIVDFLHRKRIVSSLKLKRQSHEYSITADTSDFLGALIDPVCTGHIVYNVQGKEPLDKLIYSLVPTLFKSIPYEMRRKVNDRERTFLTKDRQKTSNVGWVGLMDEGGVHLSMARAIHNVIILRYTFPVRGMFFYGTAGRDKLQHNIRKRHDKSVILL